MEKICEEVSIVISHREHESRWHEERTDGGITHLHPDWLVATKQASNFDYSGPVGIWDRQLA